MNTIKYIIIIISLISSDIFAQSVQLGVFNDPPGSNQVQIKMKTNSAINALPSNFAFTIRYPSTVTDINITPIWTAPFNTGMNNSYNVNVISNGYKYYSFFFIPDTLTQNINWVANTNYQIVNLALSGGSGATSFEITNSLGCEADIDKFYFECDFSNMINDTITPFIPEHSIVSNVSTVGIKLISTIIPDKYILEQNYPNPFNPTTIIRYQIKDLKFVNLSVYDMLGKEVVTLVNEKQSSGTYEVQFDGSNLSSGIYFCKIQAEEFSDVKRMILIK
jgi:hypothetical protein